MDPDEQEWHAGELNKACDHDPFPTPFTGDILESVAGREVYSLTDGFSGYHPVEIAGGDRPKTTFTTEWGSFLGVPNVMPFGSKNAQLYWFKDYGG